MGDLLPQPWPKHEQSNDLKWVRMFVESSEKSELARKLLMEAFADKSFVETSGYGLLSCIPVDSIWEPVAFIDGRPYRGVEAIKEWIAKYQKSLV